MDASGTGTTRMTQHLRRSGQTGAAAIISGGWAVVGLR